MKFARELDQDAVQEWKAKYLNYKQCKKSLKAIESALRDVNRTPLAAPSGKDNDTPQTSNNIGTGLLTEEPGHIRSHKSRKHISQESSENTEDDDPKDEEYGSKFRDAIRRNGHGHKRVTSTDPLFEESDDDELRRQLGNRPGMTKYGSIIGSPPKGGLADGLPSLTLPDPALSAARSHGRRKVSKAVRLPASSAGHDAGESSPSAYEAGKTRTPKHDRTKFRRSSSHRSHKGWDIVRARFLSIGHHAQSPRAKPDSDVPMNMYHELEHAQTSFFKLMDSELEKIEEFYKEKENDATKRLDVLRTQLHILRDRRLQDLNRVARGRIHAKTDANNADGSSDSDMNNSINNGLVYPWKSAVDRAWHTAVNGRIGHQTKVMEGQTTPKDFRPLDDRRDYERRTQDIEVPYRTAKRKLKLAMQEYYRSLELLKSYSLLNQTAFRKINKKYDKIINTGPSGRYMSEKVSKAHFVKSNVIDGYITACEDLYSRYFEAGNHKVAANKLRQASRQKRYHGGAMFRNGVLIALGCVWGIEGIIAGAQLLFNEDSTLVTQTSYLLQIYGGYFMMVLLMLFFCCACQFWARAKVNYVFIFEFDTRDHLDWRQLLEIPCFCFALLGFFLWINFSRYGDHEMYIYFPVIMIVATIAVLFCPFPIFYSKARLWFLNSCWRLFFSGLYPVEFRDFFLGDMFCSLTYSMGNIELFFCLYANYWANPSMCNSSHSRLLGFFSALPGIWRALQCLRRYHDTRNIFPHLVNCGKYLCTVLFYMTLSLYRVEKSTTFYALFIVFGTINGIYCSTWDLLMDWSLLNPYAKKRFLRDTLAYKQTWIYYGAMVLDPILRFNWIFYAIFAHEIQHSAILSFLISFSEVIRRGIWLVFRVENEHCTNVGRFRASRDVPLPFHLQSSDSLSALEAGQVKSDSQSAARDPATPAKAPRGSDAATTTGSEQHGTPSVRRRKGSPRRGGLARVATLLADAHAQDFERRKKDEDIVDASAAARGYGEDDDGESTDEELLGIMNLQGSDLEDREGEGEDGLHRIASRGKGKNK